MSYGYIQPSRRKKLSKAIRGMQGLVAYYPLDEITGDAINRAPSTFETLNAVVTGCTRGNAGPIGNAYDFDGNDKVVVSSGIPTNTVISCFFIFRPQVTPSGNFDVILGYGNSRWFFIYGPGTTQFGFSVKAPTEKSTGLLNFSPTIGTWYAVLGTYDPDGGANNITLRIYGAGQGLIETKTATITGAIAAGSQFEIGHDPNRNYFVAIQAQHVSIYDAVLTADQGLALATRAGLV